jgi:hypothetical protein
MSADDSTTDGASDERRGADDSTTDEETDERRGADGFDNGGETDERMEVDGLDVDWVGGGCKVDCAAGLTTEKRIGVEGVMESSGGSE